MNMHCTRRQTHIETAFRAMSDPTRLRIVNLLRGGELCVCEIVSVLDILQPAVSRHLAYLRRAGLVLSRKEGQWSHYRLAPAADEFHRKLLECLDVCARQEPALARDTRRLGRLGSGGCAPAATSTNGCMVATGDKETARE